MRFGDSFVVSMGICEQRGIAGLQTSLSPMIEGAKKLLITVRLTGSLTLGRLKVCSAVHKEGLLSVYKMFRKPGLCAELNSLISIL
jgi:hypothetical protein